MSSKDPKVSIMHDKAYVLHKDYQGLQADYDKLKSDNVAYKKQVEELQNKLAFERRRISKIHINAALK